VVVGEDVTAQVLEIAAEARRAQAQVLVRDLRAGRLTRPHVRPATWVVERMFVVDWPDGVASIEINPPRLSGSPGMAGFICCGG
jgi:hypothetical protein